MGLSEDSWKLVEALVPLYFVLFSGFISVKYFKFFTIESHETFNKFLYYFVLPSLTFKFASQVDPFNLNLRFLAADLISKPIILFFLALWFRFHPNGSFHWSITCFSLCFLTNSLVVGVPLAEAAFDALAVDLVVQTSVIQACFWLPMLNVALEFGQKRFQSSETAKALSSDGNVQKIGEDEENNLEAGTKELEETSSNNNNMLLFMVKKIFLKLITNPNIYACVFGLVWALVAKRYKLQMPKIVKGSIELFSNAGIGFAMFNMGIFMAMENKLKACGIKKAILAFVLKFIGSPAATTIASLAVGLKGEVLKVAIIQAAMPQSITAFIYANEYKLHEEVLGTSVILGALVCLPVLMVYDALLRCFS